MNHLDPLWLQSFVAICRLGSVTRAAREVHRTQSAVSTHLRQLEAAVGVRLVARSTRSLSVTAEGERLLPHAQRLLDLQAAALAAVAPTRGVAPVWRIGISEYFVPTRLAELLALLQQHSDGARLELLLAGSAALQRLWAAGEVDHAVLTSIAPLAEAKLLRREPLHWVAGPGGAPSPERPTPLVLLGPDCPVHPIALAALTRTGHAHHLQLSCSGAQAALAAIRAGWGVGCLNAAAVPPDLTVLSRQDARRWASPGRLAFYLLARPALRPLAQALQDWA
jgi:DNA-binding transcriptional LysR family regulator